LFSKASADTIEFFSSCCSCVSLTPAQLVTATRRYLDMFDWNLDDAIRSAKEDGDWEQDVEPESGSIHISVKLQNGIPVDFQATGAGLKPQPKAVSTKPVTYDGLPAIATKNVRPQDVYNVSVHLLAMDVSTFLSK
jgi:hypothetical protein